MEKLNKKDIKKDAEKRYEFRFYRYLGLVLLILFSCIFTVSNLINPGETRKLIAEMVRYDYNEFFQYEIHNSKEPLEDIYDNYSKDNNVEVYKLMAINAIYFGQAENRYLEPYIGSYTQKHDLSKVERRRLYEEVNKEIKNIENNYTFQLMIKRFSPYILAIIFVTLIMGSNSFIRKRTKLEKNIINILVFLAGTYICYISIINVKYSIWINLAIMLTLTEFIIENKTKILEYLGGAIILIILAFSILSNLEGKNNELINNKSNELVLVNNFQDINCTEGEEVVQRIGKALYSEMLKENIIAIDESKDEVNKLIEDKQKLIFNDKKTNKPLFYMCLYNDIPIYRIVFCNDENSTMVYEGVLNPYMRSTLIKLEKGRKYIKRRACGM